MTAARPVRRPAFAVSLAAALAATLGCGTDKASPPADSAGQVAVAPSSPPAATAPVDSAAAPIVGADSVPPGISRDSLLKLAHRHPPLRPVAGALSEDAVQNVVDAINASDANIAAAAVRKVSDAEVKRFAGALASAHRQRVTDSPPMRDEAGKITAPLRDMQTQSIARLDGLAAGAAFDRAFVEAQVAAHERSIALLDSIAPAAQTGDLPALVASTRAQVVRHLDQARALQRRLQ